MQELEGHIKNVWSTLTVFDKGAALEFMFYMQAKRGLPATHLKTNKEFAIPAVEEMWLQPSYGNIPPFVGNDYSRCLMVKLAQGHITIDYLIVDCISTGEGGRKLYLGQISVQPYQKRKTNRKYSAINQQSQQLSLSTAKDYSKNKLNCSRCYYIYASSAESEIPTTISKDFYSVNIVNT